MQASKNDDIEIINTTKEDFPDIIGLFERAMELQGKNGYKVWDDIDKPALAEDIEKRLQYKVLKGNDLLCIFTIQHNDPFIWRSRDNNDAIYLHRMIANPTFKGQKLFEKILSWAKEFARNSKLKFIRMDTWADNIKIINYYKSFGFEHIENYTTTNAPELPLQNRNLNVALLEMKVS